MNVGFIGLGAMGQHMARNLPTALLAGAWNRTTTRAEAFAADTGCARSPPDGTRRRLRLHLYLRFCR